MQELHDIISSGFGVFFTLSLLNSKHKICIQRCSADQDIDAER